MPYTPIYPDNYEKTPRRTYSLHFYIDSVPITYEVASLATSLGGSESAAILTGRELAARGHEVTFHSPKVDPDIDGKMVTGIKWMNIRDSLDAFDAMDIDSFTSLRMPQIFTQRIKARHRCLWNQDMLIDRSSAACIAPVDELLFVSDYHRRQWIHEAAELEHCKYSIVCNPIDLRLIPTKPPVSATKSSPYLVHTSRPERGYDAIMKLWPVIKQRHPDLHLKISRYSSMYDSAGWGKICKQYEQAIQTLEDVSLEGVLGKKQLYKLISGARALIYPTSGELFSETNCITVSEAMACQTPLVADRRGAIPETMHPDGGVLVDNPTGNHWRSDQYRDDFCDAVDTVLDPSKGLPGPKAMEKARAVDGRVAALLWEQRLDSFFETRYKSNKVRILRELLHNDNHVAGRLLAQRIQDDKAEVSNRQEAADAEHFCQRVIDQLEQTADNYANFAIQDAELESSMYRYEVVVDNLLDSAVKGEHYRLIDIACGNMSFDIAMLRKAREKGVTLEIDTYDYSKGVFEIGMKGLRTAELKDGLEPNAYTDCVNTHTVDFREVDTELGSYDIVFCGEFLEHVEHPEKLIDTLESFAKPNGLICITTPCGPLSDYMLRMPKQRGHLHSFTYFDLQNLVGEKRDVVQSLMTLTPSPLTGERCGHWICYWRPGGGKSQAVDYEKQILTTRPRQRIVASMITKNAEDHLIACLKSLHWCDDVYIYDTGSEDSTVTLARHSVQAKVKQGYWDDNFSAARNRSLDWAINDGNVKPDWIFWIDADETLVGGEVLRYMLEEGRPYNAIALKQHHLQVDLENFHDTPCRVFRTEPIGEFQGYETPQFFGMVHEQPEFEVNKGITPALLLEGVEIVHVGYRTKDIRDAKAYRNYAILRREIESKPERELSWALWMRDLCQHAERNPKHGRDMLSEVIRIWKDKGWDDPSEYPILHKLAWPFYQIALQKLGYGVHVVASVSASTTSAAKPVSHEKFLAWDTEEAKRLLAWRASKVLDPLKKPDLLLT